MKTETQKYLEGLNKAGYMVSEDDAPIQVIALRAIKKYVVIDFNEEEAEYDVRVMHDFEFEGMPRLSTARINEAQFAAVQIAAKLLNV